MNNHRNILLKEGLTLSRIIIYSENNDEIESTFSNNLSTDFKNEINWDLIFPNFINFKDKKCFQDINIVSKNNNKFPNSEQYFNISKKEKKIKRKRGRQTSKININSKHEKVHKNTDFDNLLRKIQVHFLNFLINFSNDALKNEFSTFPYSFKLINTKTKETIYSKMISELKEKSINFFLKLDISFKFKTFKASHNKDLLENKKIKNSQWLNELFNMDYTELFKHYYNNKNPLKNFEFNNKIIYLSEKTKSFYYLLKNNEKIKQHLIKVVNDVFGLGFRPFSLIDGK